MHSLSTKLSDADYARLGDFRYALRCFLEFSEAAAAREGLTPQQHQALLVIRSSPEAVSIVKGRNMSNASVVSPNACGFATTPRSNWPSGWKPRV